MTPTAIPKTSATVTVLGHVGSGAATLKDENGTPRLGFTVATLAQRPDGAALVEVTTWWHVRTYGALAQSLVGRLQPGDLVQVVGEASLEKWTTRTGTVNHDLLLIADRVLTLTAHRAQS